MKEMLMYYRKYGVMLKELKHNKSS